VLDPQVRIARPAQALFEIVAVEARLGHLVGAQLLARDPRRAGRADAAAQAVFGAIVVGPALHPVRILGDIGHQVPELARRVRREQLGRQPEHVEMTICRDSPVLHELISLWTKPGAARRREPASCRCRYSIPGFRGFPRLRRALILPGWHAAW